MRGWELYKVWVERPDDDDDNGIYDRLKSVEGVFEISWEDSGDD